MIEIYTTQIEIKTRGRGLYEITSKLQQFVRESKITEGVVHLLIQHTSASLLIQENADPIVKSDLDAFFGQICPDGSPIFRHTYEGPDDMSAHVRSSLTPVSLSIPIINGELALGTWQGVYVWEHRIHGSIRVVAVTIIGKVGK